MGSNSHLVLYPINQSMELNLVCIIRKKLENNEDIKTILENKILKQNKKLENFFKGDLKKWPIYVSRNPIKSIYQNVLYAGDAFHTFPPVMAQGASQAIEAASEIFNLIKENHPDIQNVYFKNRLEKTNLINKRSKINYFSFHISNSVLKIFRNKILKILIKNKKFINNYLGKVYK
jgi:salicylate hydroxylase